MTNAGELILEYVRSGGHLEFEPPNEDCGLVKMRGWSAGGKSFGAAFSGVDSAGYMAAILERHATPRVLPPIALASQNEKKSQNATGPS